MSHHDELPRVDPDALDGITGGITSSPSTSSAANTQLTTALQGITSSLSSLGSSPNNASSMQSLLPMMLMLGKGGGGGACPCGCGMANCMRRQSNARDFGRDDPDTNVAQLAGRDRCVPAAILMAIIGVTLAIRAVAHNSSARAASAHAEHGKKLDSDKATYTQGDSHRLATGEQAQAEQHADVAHQHGEAAEAVDPA